MRILVIEDEARMGELLREGLTEEGHTVTVALDGREGLEIAEGWEFDLIILDVMLPGMDGFAIARRLRAQHNQTPILMLTFVALESNHRVRPRADGSLDWDAPAVFEYLPSAVARTG